MIDLTSIYMSELQNNLQNKEFRSLDQETTPTGDSTSTSTFEITTSLISITNSSGESTQHSSGDSTTLGTIQYSNILWKLIQVVEYEYTFNGSHRFDSFVFNATLYFNPEKEYPDREQIS
ncbi:hypothetical protein PPL_08481 [Heterostelium album PN500]|uniref:Uncharacterized protein n=1 Tax=Heterostelium pallidum (strain ATCC 26659 / Pp 5 / PN500) TaxID=670386 RepID=D3BIB3_HETP5|nr:hypothetical protein PPL_08481 [Heterostelium album PN500]EFA79013.1 hypothetical protein PPL_08481 [Heterostelium album PN500]|eukprot:XP_020431136.1 hypothetical protein PPL_08481 [Heterostelium album PN500]